MDDMQQVQRGSCVCKKQSTNHFEPGTTFTPRVHGLWEDTSFVIVFGFYLHSLKEDVLRRLGEQLAYLEIWPELQGSQGPSGEAPNIFMEHPKVHHS